VCAWEGRIWAINDSGKEKIEEKNQEIGEVGERERGKKIISLKFARRRK
jgi:hypothetical protein